MKNVLDKMVGKEIDLICEGAAVSGNIKKVDGTTLHLEKDGVTCFVNIDKISIIWDSKDRKGTIPGFINTK